jgi:hypothetical protein
MGVGTNNVVGGSRDPNPILLASKTPPNPKLSIAAALGSIRRATTTLPTNRQAEQTHTRIPS